MRSAKTFSKGDTQVNQQDKEEQTNQQTSIEDLTVDEAQESEVKGSRGYSSYDWSKNVKI